MAKKNENVAKCIFVLLISAIPITIIIGMISYNIPGGTYIAGVVPFPIDTFLIIVILGIYALIIGCLTKWAKKSKR